MNKSLITNLIAIIVVASAFLLQQPILLMVGLFALSGAITNWLAIHMLFEKIPGLYGSGVIPARFEEFKVAIQSLMMEQFFTNENIDRFLRGSSNGTIDLQLAPVIEKVDLEPAFDSLVEVILASSMGKMLGMFGGESALETLREPFVGNLKSSLITLSLSDDFQSMLRDEIEQPDVMANIQSNVEKIIQQRLNELTPKLVKEMVQKMIKQHLGWLVVWGGVFGALIGLITALLQKNSLI